MKKIIYIIFLTIILPLSASASEEKVNLFKDRHGEVLSIQCVRALDVSLAHVKNFIASSKNVYGLEFENFIEEFDLIECIDAGDEWVIGFRVVEEFTGTVARDSSVRVMIGKENLAVTESSLQ